MIVEINQQVKSPFKSNWMAAIVRLVLPASWQVSVALVGPLEIKKINRHYRRQNKVTDVLSFLYEPRGGEIVICFPQVRRQARQNKVPVAVELARLLIHGALHLKGYSDQTLAAAAKMTKLENKYLRYVKF